MPAPSGQIPPPWAWWENEAPATRAKSPAQATIATPKVLVLPDHLELLLRRVLEFADPLVDLAPVGHHLAGASVGLWE